MVVYNFKKIAVVPGSKDFIDIVLSKTQRKTPTVVHPQYNISRIRHFYMRKVKFAQQTFHDKLSLILEGFPILSDIHPFYGDLMNILYDRDHYKLALGQLNTARRLIDQIATDYLKLLKYGDSLYRCKQLKRAALGRMCTLMKKQTPSLAYLEQVRQHLARLPSIDPNTRTIVLCGYPNVGKSSFLNKITRADVDVQPYPFTTKSLFVGHTDYQYLRWQVIDTPGILDHPLEERNTIEMQAITALAHLRATIVFIVDISEHCGYSLKQQVSLFKSLQPLFVGKPIMVVANKIDVVKYEELSAEYREMLEELKVDGTEIVPMSTFTDDGVSQVKQKACEKLLSQRVEMKLQGMKFSDSILNRLHVALPVPRDDKERPPVIPENLKMSIDNAEGIEDNTKQPLSERPEEIPFWMRGWSTNEWKEKYMLRNKEWNFDPIPEIIDGNNVADFIDPDILQKLEELEKEEEEREFSAANEMTDDDNNGLNEEDMKLVKKIRERRKLIVQRNRLNKSRNAPVKPRIIREETTSLDSHLAELGVERSGRKRTRSSSVALETAKRYRESSRSRSRSRGAAAHEERSRSSSIVGFKNIKQKQHAASLLRKDQKMRNREAKKGEGDRTIVNLRPKHLLTGKRKAGKTQRR